MTECRVHRDSNGSIRSSELGFGVQVQIREPQTTALSRLQLGVASRTISELKFHAMSLRELGTS